MGVKNFKRLLISIPKCIELNSELISARNQCEKINLIPAFLKLETLLFQKMFILFYHILYL